MQSETRGIKDFQLNRRSYPHKSCFSGNFTGEVHDITAIETINRHQIEDRNRHFHIGRRESRACHVRILTRHEDNEMMRPFKVMS